MQDDGVEEPTEQMTTEYSPPSDEAARWVFDYEKVYWQMKANLYGGWLVEDKKGVYVIKKPRNAKQFMNTEGIESTMALINGFISKLQSISDFDEERILQLCNSINDKLAIFYYQNMDKFDLTEERASVVIRMIMTNIEANFKKSLNGASMRMLGTTEKVITTRDESPRKIMGFRF